MPQRSEFQRTPVIEIRAFADAKQDKAIRNKAIRIRNIDAAGKRLVADYPDLAGWFCLSVKHRAEFAVEDALRESGIIACVPRCMGELRYHRGRKIPAPILPVIPGYMLVKCVPSVAAFVGLRSIDRVTGIVGKGETPYRVPAAKIEHFIALAAEGTYDHRHIVHSFEMHEIVRVSDGPFASFHATITDLTGTEESGRLNVEVNIFGRMTPVELDIAQIEKV